MPCRSDYLEANERELESRRVCQHLRYLLKALGKNVPAAIAKAADEYYGDVENLDKNTALLCKMCQEVDDKHIYNGRDPEARKLADWWDDHQERDRKRLAQEEADKHKAALRATALSKLTKAERDALGVK